MSDSLPLQIDEALHHLQADGDIARGYLTNILRAAKSRLEKVESDSLLEANVDLRAQRDNLAMMLRRGAWLCKKQTGDTGQKVWAGQATDLLRAYALEGSPLRSNESKETTP